LEESPVGPKICSWRRFEPSKIREVIRNIRAALDGESRP
jgi:hypothetical protein